MTELTEFENAPPPAEPSLGPERVNHEAACNRPHTAQGAEHLIDGERRTFTRKSTFRLEPSREQYALLRLRDAQATQYMNRFSVHLYAERNGWRVPDADKEKPTSTVHCPPDDLSAAIYVAAQKRVKNDWARIGKRIWSGVQVPTYRKGSLPFDSGGRPERGGSCGVKIVQLPDGHFGAELHATAAKSAGDNWIAVPLGRGTERDERRQQLAAEFATGLRDILNGEISFRDNKVLLQVAYKIERVVPAMGDRVATLSEFEDGRLLLRAEFGRNELDYSSRLNAFKAKKDHWDGIRRRFGRRASRRKGSARTARQKFAQVGFADWSATEMHTWSADMVRWLQAQGCGYLTVILTGGDWPAHDLTAKLKYKCEEAGIELKEASLDDTSTERAATAVVKKRQRKAKKVGDAVRTVINHINGDRP